MVEQPQTLKTPDLKTTLFLVSVVGPLLLAPVLAVEFPRILAYLPIASGVIGALVLWFGFRQRPVFSKELKVILGGMIALVTVSLLWTVNQEVAAERVQKLVVILPLYGLLIGVLAAGVVQIPFKTLPLMLSACAAGAAFVAIEIQLGEPVYRLIRDIGPDEAFSTAVYNRAALSIVFIALTVLMYVPKTPRIWALFIPVAVMLFFVQSQSAQLAFIVGLAFYVLFPVGQRWAWIVLYGVIAIGVAAKPFITGAALKAISRDVQEIPLIKDAYIGDRLEIWDFISRKALESPIFGHGLEFTKTYEGFQAVQLFVQTNTTLHPHSFILQLWIELGALGILAFLAGLGALLSALYKIENKAHKKAALTSLMMCLLVASFSYGMWQSWWLGLLCIVTAMNIIGQQSAQNGKS